MFYYVSLLFARSVRTLSTCLKGALSSRADLFAKESKISILDDRTCVYMDLVRNRAAVQGLYSGSRILTAYEHLERESPLPVINNSKNRFRLIAI